MTQERVLLLSQLVVFVEVTRTQMLQGYQAGELESIICLKIFDNLIQLCSCFFFFNSWGTTGGIFSPSSQNSLTHGFESLFSLHRPIASPYPVDLSIDSFLLPLGAAVKQSQFTLLKPTHACLPEWSYLLALPSTPPERLSVLRSTLYLQTFPFPRRCASPCFLFASLPLPCQTTNLTESVPYQRNLLLDLTRKNKYSFSYSPSYLPLFPLSLHNIINKMQDHLLLVSKRQACALSRV